MRRVAYFKPVPAELGQPIEAAPAQPLVFEPAIGHEPGESRAYLTVVEGESREQSDQIRKQHLPAAWQDGVAKNRDDERTGSDRSPHGELC